MKCLVWICRLERSVWPLYGDQLDGGKRWNREAYLEVLLVLWGREDITMSYERDSDDGK